MFKNIIIGLLVLFLATVIAVFSFKLVDFNSNLKTSVEINQDLRAKLDDLIAENVRYKEKIAELENQQDIS